MSSIDDYYDTIRWIREHGRGVTGWEDDFLNSIELQIDCKGELSSKQEEVLNRIFDKRVGMVRR